MRFIFELDYKHVDRSPQIGWSGLKKLDSGIKLNSGTKWKKDLRIENSKG